MSVINKMLKDLDEQQRQRIVRPNLTSAALPQPGRARRNWWWLVLPLSLALLVVSWVGLWPKLQARMAPPVAQTVEAPQPTAVAILPDVTGAQVIETEETPAPAEVTPLQPITEGQPEATVSAVERGSDAGSVNAREAATVAAAEEAVIAPKIEVAPATEVAVSAAKPTPQERELPVEVAPKPQPVMVVSPARLSPQQQAQLLYQQARDSGDLDGLRQALALDNQLHPARVLLAQRLAHSDPGQAMVLLAEASGRYPGQPEYPLTAAELALGAGDRQQAKLWLGQLNQQPLPLPLVARRAVLARELSMLTLAVSDYQGLVNAQPQEGRWWLGLAHSLDRLGRYGDAVSAYRRGLATGSLSDSARLYIEQRLQQLGDAG